MSQIAQTILSQIGGQRFAVMTGAKNFLSDATGLYFQLPARFAKDGIRYVHIELDLGRDTYNVEFKGAGGVLVSRVEDVYCDMLREVFTSATGLETSLGRVCA